MFRDPVRRTPHWPDDELLSPNPIRDKGRVADDSPTGLDSDRIRLLESGSITRTWMRCGRSSILNTALMESEGQVLKFT
jgi:hypothetical protein